MIECQNENKWYLAQLIMHLSIENLEDIEIHKNLILLKATSHEHAYEKSIALGKYEETDFLNSQNQNVHIKFLGLAELEELISKEIYDGVELTFSRYINPKINEIEKMLVEKESLKIFACKDVCKKDNADYGAQYIRDIINQK